MCKTAAIVQNTGASWLQMEMPAIASKQSSALMVRRPSGKFVTVENKGINIHDQNQRRWKILEIGGAPMMVHVQACSQDFQKGGYMGV